MNDKTLEMTMLYDFFGDLLTEKQREYFDLYYNDDLSLSEIAETAGISRQGVRDNIVRAEHLLWTYEEKTGLIRRFREIQEGLLSVEKDAAALAACCRGVQRETAERILGKLQDLKG